MNTPTMGIPAAGMGFIALASGMALRTAQEVKKVPATGKIGDVETITPEGESKEIEAELNTVLGEKAPANAEALEKGEKPEKL